MYPTLLDAAKLGEISQFHLIGLPIPVINAITPIALQNFADKGYDMLMPMMFMTNMAIAGATFAMFFKAKNKMEKSIIISATISALLGITEPAVTAKLE